MAAAKAPADTTLLSVEDYAGPGQALAEALGIGHVLLAEHRFPDGESLVTLPPRPGPRVLVYCSLDRPDERLIPLLLALHGLREAGVGWIGLVAPYLAYMRQDAAFHPGEVISQRIIASLLAEPIDALWTVDPHLHRVASLDEVFPRIRSTALTAGPLLADWVRAHAADAVLIGPDRESAQWVRAIADQCGSPWGVAEKTRLGDREVCIRLPEIPVAGRRCVLVDDVASTGRTLAGATEQLLQAGAAAVDVLVTHALFVGDAEDTLRGSGAERLLSTNSIAHTSNALDLAPLLAPPIAAELRRAQS
jgi:ribose-phosphate pyrophosphokinase